MTLLARRDLVKCLLAAAAAPHLGATAARGRAKGANAMSDHPTRTSSADQRTPVVFVGHGSPMNAIEDNAWSRRFRDLAKELPRPKAILAISAHWYVAGTFTTSNDRPETIHDFGGFPEALYRIDYPAPGDPTLARRIVALLEVVRGRWARQARVHPDRSEAAGAALLARKLSQIQRRRVTAPRASIG